MKQNEPSALRALVNGHSLAFRAWGSGLPAVIFETGLGAESAEWDGVAEMLSNEARVFRYDRAGRGESDGVTEPRGTKEMVADLQDLLTK